MPINHLRRNFCRIQFYHDVTAKTERPPIPILGHIIILSIVRKHFSSFFLFYFFNSHFSLFLSFTFLFFWICININYTSVVAEKLASLRRSLCSLSTV